MSPGQAAPERDNVVNAVVRVLAVIEALNLQPVSSLEMLHQATGLPKPTLVRLLETLMSAGYAQRVSRREGYAVTEAVLRLSAGVRARDVLVDVARPLMEAFTNEHRWQVSLGTHEEGKMLIRATTRHISPYSRNELFLNRRVDMLSSVIGRAYFAYCAAPARELILDIARATDTPDRKIANMPGQVERIVSNVRGQRHAANSPKRPGSHSAIAIPILATHEREEALGAIVLFYYRSVLSEREAVARYLQPLYELAGRIAQGVEESHLQWNPPGITTARDVGTGS